MNDTLCWHCSKSYDIKAAKCPHCGAANGNHDLEKAQAAALPERSPTEKEEAEVLALAEDYGQWMWDSGYMDNPTGETLVDEAAAKREEIEKALNSALVSAYADGRRDEAEENEGIGRLIDAWAAAHGKPVPWAKAVEIVAISKKLPDAERVRLLALGEEE